MSDRMDQKSIWSAWCWLYGLWCPWASVHPTRQ